MKFKIGDEVLYVGHKSIAPYGQKGVIVDIYTTNYTDIPHDGQEHWPDIAYKVFFSKFPTCH